SYTGNTSYELVIRPEAGATSVELTSSINGNILDFIGARNVILDGRAGGTGASVLTVNNNSTSGALAGISFEGQTRDIAVKYCKIVYMGVGIRTVGGGINDPENVTIENCTFSTPEINTTLTNLLAINHNCTSTSSMTIRNNVLESPNIGTGSVGTYLAMYIRSAADIYNNMIAVGDIPADKIYGIRTNYGSGMNIDHNTIAFEGGSTSNATEDVWPLYFQHAGEVTIANNILTNGFDCGVGCTRGLVKHQTTYGGTLAGHDNALGISINPDSEAEIFWYQKDGLSANADITEDFPGNSINLSDNFNFIDFANCDLELTESALSSIVNFRTINPSQTTDIYGTSRDADLATKGAIESDFTSDANIYAMSAPELTSVSVQDFGTSGRIYIEVENPTTDFTFTPTFTLAPGATIDPEGGESFDYSRVVNYTVFFDVTAANGTDIKRWILYLTGLNSWPGGTYSVGEGLDFESIDEAATAFNIFGIEGDVILELEDGYSGAWGNFYGGEGLDDYTITIRPEEGATNITAPYSNTGGKNIILDGRPGGVGESVLSFRALSYLASGTQGVIRHVSFSNQAGNGLTFGLRVYGNTANVTIENCSYTRPVALGTPTGSKFSTILIMTGQDLTIRNNKIYDFKYTPSSGSAEFNGIEIVGDVTGKTEIYNNVISIKPEKFVPQYGIKVSSTTGEVDIHHNTINIEDSGTDDQTGIYTGIQISSDPSILNIQNNIVSNTSPGTRRGILYTMGSGEKNVDFNNVSGTLPFTYTGTITDATAFKSAFINSTTEDVSFTDPATGDLSLNSNLNNNSYVRTTFDSGVAEDINGTSRSTFPMKGAYDAEGSGFNDILQLSFENSDDLVIDSDAATVSVSAHPDTDLSSLVVDITLPPNTSISPDPSIGRDYTSPVVFTVTSENDMDKDWTVTVLGRNVAPEGLTLSSPELDENAGEDALVSVLLPYDPNVGDTHDFSLVDGDGADDHAFFYITDNMLYSYYSQSHESKAVRSIRVEVVDQGGLSAEFVLEIAINDINEAPEYLDVDENEFNEGIEAGTFISFFDLDDEDEDDSHTLTFVTGEGDEDNSKFDFGFNQEDGHYLITLVDFDYETQNEFSIRVRVTDAGGLSGEFVVPIFVDDIAEDPTDILLSPSAIDENNEVDDEVGVLSAVDDDIEDTHIYSLVTGDGDTDNASFSVNEVTGQIVAKEVFDRETKSNYSIRVETDDQNGGVFSRQITIEINDVNEVPTDVDLDNKSVNESMPVGTVVGILSTEDVDVGDTHTYTIEEGCAECRTLGDATDNFIIVGNELRTNTIFDFETQEEYFITITSTDEGGLSFPNGYIIIINNLPAQITAVELDNASINENEDVGTLVGTLSTFGEDLSGSFTYDLVEGSGSEDNASFTISGSELLTTESFNHEVKNSYAIRVKTDDGNGYTLEQELTITIEDVSEATDTNILTFVLGEQTGEADIDIVNNTVSIEVAYGTNLTNLSPTITVSAGATISPSDVTDFSAAVTYTVTAEEPTVTEEWTVTVTEAASNETDILTFALVAQTSEATINAANHTVSIEVANGTDLTDLEPTITVSAGASISPSGAQDFSESVAYTVTAEDGSTTQSWEVTVTEAPSNATDILTFELAAQTGGATVDASNHTIAVEVAFGTDLTSLNPTITVSAGASISPSGPQDFSSGFTYTVTAEDQTTTQEWVVTVTEAENEEVLAVADLEAKLKIYPNPASNQLQVEGLTGETAVEFFDLSGHMVLFKNMNDKGSIELADIKPGLYHVRFTNDKISTTTRLLIRR
ncbi:cadherin domain-containing protein, partial [Reichenbachiella sp.]